MTPYAVVLNLTETGLAAARSLGRRGVQVVGLDFDATHSGFASRYCDARVSSHPVAEPERLLAQLMDLAGRLGGRPILFPASDAYTLFVSRHRDVLAPRFRFNLSPEHVIEAIADKRRQYDLAVQAGVTCPRTFIPETASDLETAARALSYPAVLKPAYSHLAGKAFKGAKALPARDPVSLLAQARPFVEAGEPVLLQSQIVGPPTSHMKFCGYVSQDGRLAARFTLRKIRQQPWDFGVGCLVESFHDAELEAIGATFFEAIGYRGIGSAEFKLDDRDGQIKLIELNPRLWQQNGLAADCGVDMAWIQYCDLAGLPAPEIAPPPEGVRWLDGRADLQSVLRALASGDLRPASVPGSYLGTRSFACFAWDDPAPFLRSTVVFGAKLLKAGRKLPAR